MLENKCNSLAKSLILDKKICKTACSLIFPPPKKLVNILDEDMDIDNFQEENQASNIKKAKCYQLLNKKILTSHIYRKTIFGHYAKQNSSKKNDKPYQKSIILQYTNKRWMHLLKNN